TDADVGGFRFAGAVDDAAHHGQGERFDAFILLLPSGHAVADIALNALGELLKCGAGGAAAAGACGHAGQKRAETQGLQEFAAGINLFATIAPGTRRERDTDRIADAFFEEDAHCRRRPDRALHAHAGFGQAEVQRLPSAPGELAIDRDKVTWAR